MKVFYQPTFVGEAKIAQEFRRVAEAINSVQFGRLELAYAVPAKPRQGVLYLADGVQWNPTGTGALTPVWFDGEEWQAFGSGGGGSVSLLVETTFVSASSYTLLSGDALKCVEMDYPSANQLIVPADVFEVGMQIQIRQSGAGQTSISAEGGVTLRSPLNYVIRAQWGTIALHQRMQNDWVLMGDLA